jgi:hypothetical protein
VTAPDFAAERAQWEAECKWLGHVVPWPTRRRGGRRQDAESLGVETIKGLQRAIRCGNRGVIQGLTRATGVTRQTLQAALHGRAVMASTKLILERWLADYQAVRQQAAE